MDTHRSSSPRLFGDVYVASEADPQLVAVTLGRTLEDAGFGVSLTVGEAGFTAVAATQRAPWHLVVWKALPQEMLWEIAPNERGVTVRFDRWYFPWYRRLVLCSSAVTAALFWTGSILVLSPDRAIRPSCVILMAALAMAFLAWRWCAAGSRLIESLRLRAYAELRIHGIALDHAPLSSNSRWERNARRYVGFFAGVCALPTAAALSTGLSFAKHPWLTLLVGIAATLIGVCMVVVFRSGRWRGFEPRLLPALPGLAAMAVLFICLGSQVPMLIAATKSPTFWEKAFDVRDSVARVSPSVQVLLPPGQAPVDLTEWRDVWSVTHAMMVVSVLSVPLLWGIAGVCAYSSLRSLELVISHARRLQQAPDLETIRMAVSGAGFLPRYRGIVIAIWLLFSVLSIGLLGRLIQSGFLAVWGQPEGWTTGGDDIAAVTAHAIKLSFGMPADSVAAEVLSRSMWAWWAVLALVALGASVCSLLARRQRARATLRRLTISPQTITDNLQRTARELAAIVNMPVPRVVVAHDPTPHAAAHEFGTMERFLVITTGCLDALTAEERRAVLAHECAHFLKGHCRIHYLLQIAGRLTFVGDTFVGTLEQSFGYELEADRSAIEDFGVNPGALDTCLRKLRDLATLQRLYPGGLRAASERPMSLTPAPSAGSTWRLADAGRLWLKLFASDTQFAYWHPAVNHRVEAIRRMQPTSRTVLQQKG